MVSMRCGVGRLAHNTGDVEAVVEELFEGRFCTPSAQKRQVAALRIMTTSVIDTAVSVLDAACDDDSH
jgi:hypothetical protein